MKTPHRPPPYVFSDDEIRRLFHVIDTQPLSEMSNRALVDPVLFRVFYATGVRLSEGFNLEVRDFEPAHATIEVRDGKNHENRLVPITARLATSLQSYIAAAHPRPVPAHKLFYTGDPAKPADKSTIYNRFRRYSPTRTSLISRAARTSIRCATARRPEPASVGGRRRGPQSDAAISVRVHGSRRPARNPVLPPADRGRASRGRRHGPSQVRLRHPEPGRATSRPAVSRVNPVGGIWPAGGCRGSSPTTWPVNGPVRPDHRLLPGRDQTAADLVSRCGGTRPEKLRLADLDRARVLSFLDWLEAARGNSAATRNQRLAVIKSFVRYTAVERPEFLDQATQILAVKQKKTPAPDLGHFTGGEVKALLTEPDAATRRGLRDTVLLSMLYDTAARVQEICDLNASDVRAARPMVVSLRGKGSKTRRVPLMDPTAHLWRTTSSGARPTLASALTLTRCSAGRNRPD